MNDNGIDAGPFEDVRDAVRAMVGTTVLIEVWGLASIRAMPGVVASLSGVLGPLSEPDDPVAALYSVGEAGRVGFNHEMAWARWAVVPPSDDRVLYIAQDGLQLVVSSERRF